MSKVALAYPLPSTKKISFIFTMPHIPIKEDKKVAVATPTPTDDGRRQVKNMVPEELHTMQGVQKHCLVALAHCDWS
jgi:hypothetical protein